MDKFWTMRVPVLSTGHVSQETMKELEVGGSWPMVKVLPYPEGCFIHFEDATPGDEVPQSLRDVANWARIKDFQWVRLDRDGDYIPGLTQYEW